MTIWARELAALDFETTGLSAEHGDRVVEVAVVRGGAGGPARAWSTLVNPGRPVAATSVHGITDAMVCGAPTFAQALPRLMAGLEGAVLVAHNARFDLSFLEMECARAGVSAPDAPVLDTLGLARRVLPLASHSLASVCAHFGIARDRAHRAADDAAATLDVAWRLLAMADPGRRMSVDLARGLCRRRTAAEQRAVAAVLQKACDAHEPVLIDYQGAQRPDGLVTRRTITVRKVTANRVEAYCHLRGEDRIFRLDRIRLV
ncbi:MAG: exonuclease domain-containing protein [Myxococcota bacterium]